MHRKLFLFLISDDDDQLWCRINKLLKALLNSFVDIFGET